MIENALVCAYHWLSWGWMAFWGPTIGPWMIAALFIFGFCLFMHAVSVD